MRSDSKMDWWNWYMEYLSDLWYCLRLICDQGVREKVNERQYFSLEVIDGKGDQSKQLETINFSDSFHP